MVAVGVDKVLGGLRRHDFVILVTIHEPDQDAEVMLSSPLLDADQTHLVQIHDGQEITISLAASQLKESRHGSSPMLKSPALNRYWHIFVPGVQPGQMYPQLLRVWAIGETPLSSFRGLATSSQTTEGLFGFLG
jgi:hypothetical protein